MHIHGKFNGCGTDHVGHADLFERVPYNSVDALPVAAYMATGLDAAGAGQSGAFGKPERLLFKRVYNVGHTDLAARSAKSVAATRATASGDHCVLAQQVGYLAYVRLAQTQ